MLAIKSQKGRLQIPLLILSELTFIPPEIIRKPYIFWWCQGEQKLTDSLKFAIIST